MILKKIKNLIQENRQYHKKNLLQLKELEWAHIYHDSIRGKHELGELSLNIGRWAGNYTFFYILNRILNDYKPKNILEFGLGESTKFVSTFIKSYIPHSNHLIIEQDEKWKEHFESIFDLNANSKIEVCPLIKKKINSFDVNCYKDLESVVTNTYDLYIIDGPFGSEHFSRYDIVELAKKFESKDDFIILIDDYQRIGEKETVNELIKILKAKNINIYMEVYEGNKSVCVLVTEKYKHLRSI